METIAEQLIVDYLTRGGKVFIAPQYRVPHNGGATDWACPDFVALDFGRSEVVVVEVTTGASMRKISKAFGTNRDELLNRIKSQLHEDFIPVNGWEFRCLGFVRDANVKKAYEVVKYAPQVAFKALEDVTFDVAAGDLH